MLYKQQNGTESAIRVGVSVKHAFESAICDIISSKQAKVSAICGGISSKRHLDQYYGVT